MNNVKQNIEEPIKKTELKMLQKRLTEANAKYTKCLMLVRDKPELALGLMTMISNIKDLEGFIDDIKVAEHEKFIEERNKKLNVIKELLSSIKDDDNVVYVMYREWGDYSDYSMDIEDVIIGTKKYLFVKDLLDCYCFHKAKNLNNDDIIELL